MVDERRVSVRDCRALLQTAVATESPILESVIANMRKDEITDLIRNDSLIRRFMHNQLEKYENDVQKIPLIRSRSRDVGRLLNQIHKSNPTLRGKVLQDFILPDMFDKVVEATRELSQKGETDDASHAASLPLKLGQILQKLSGIVKGLAIRDGNHDLLDKVTRFATLQETEWSDRVSMKARRLLYNRRLNKPVEIPKTEDVVKLSDMLFTEAEERYAAFMADQNPETGRKLADAVLAQVICFNKRRGGEASRMTVQNYEDGVKRWEKTDFKGEIFCSLDDEEKELARFHFEILVKGKCGRHVSVVLTRWLKEKLDALLTWRQHLGIPDDNPYFFGVPKCKSHTRAWSVLRQFGQQFQLPRITSTGMRKYLATCAQVMNLSDQEIGWLANHLGHSVDVHRKHYRTHSSVIELGKITKLLHNAQSGTLHTQKGKNFDTMQVEFSHTQQLSNIADEDSAYDGSNDSDEEEPAEQEPVPSRGQKRSKKGEGGGKRRKKEYDEDISPEERAKVIEFYEGSIARKTLPKKDEIKGNYIQKEGSRLNWMQIKGILNAQISRRRYHEEKNSKIAKVNGKNGKIAKKAKPKTKAKSNGKKSGSL